MTIWVDSDSCPARVREIVCRAAMRRKVRAVFVANRPIPLPPGRLIESVVVAAEDQSADAYILECAEPDDVAITRDIPLAAGLVERNLVVLNDRGDIYTAENVRERLSIRDHMYELRSNGVLVAEQSSFGRRQIFQFSNAFDRILTQRLKTD